MDTVQSFTGASNLSKAVNKHRPCGYEPTDQLKVYGSLADILNSDASAEFKAVCIEMSD